MKGGRQTKEYGKKKGARDRRMKKTQRKGNKKNALQVRNKKKDEEK